MDATANAPVTTGSFLRLIATSDSLTFSLFSFGPRKPIGRAGEARFDVKIWIYQLCDVRERRRPYCTASVAVAGLNAQPTATTTGSAAPEGVLPESWMFNCKKPSMKVGAAPSNATMAATPPTVTEAP